MKIRVKTLITFITLAALSFSSTVFAADPPKIVRFSPENGASDVPTSTAEIEIEFDQPMAPTFSFYGDCDAGACYKQGFWKTDRIFAVTTKLIPNHKYTLGIGNVKTGHQQFGANGVGVVPLNWEFTTVAE